MASYRATTDWRLEAGGDFPKGRYSRGHSISFGSGHVAPGTASPHVVGARWAAAGAVDPEEMLVASINSCHMLSFLHVAREAGFAVSRYRDEAEGVMTPNEVGDLWVSKVTLRPQVSYAGPEPTAAEADALHEKAHHICFIANSVKTEIVVQPL